MPQFSVRSRILAVILIVTALGMSIAGGAAYLSQRADVLATVDSRLELSAATVTALMRGQTFDDPATESSPPQSAIPDFADVSEALQYVTARVLPDANESSVALVNGAPRWVPAVEMDFRVEEDREFLDRVVQEMAGSDDSLRGTAITDFGPLRYIATPVTFSAAEDSGIFLTAIDLEAELEPTNTAFTIYVWTALGALVVIGLAGWIIAGRLLSPIRQLRSTASQITATDLSERIPVRGTDDVSMLTETINDMFDRLEESQKALSSLLADVRHELMTPITIVRGHLELLDVDDTSDVEATRALAIDELDRMARLVRDIEILTTVEGATALSIAPTDIAELTEQVYAKASAWDTHTWELHTAAPVVADLDASRITQAWLQLADNARKYSPAGTTVRIGSEPVDDGVELWVDDEGPGVPEEARDRVFARLGRADTGRGVSGSGLGLAIVTAIAARHGGRVTLESSTQGSRFGIIIPIAHVVAEQEEIEV